MNRRDLLIIFIIALLARTGVAAFQAQPGYMDAYYYTVGAQRLVDGFGFSEPYVWNYLDDPTSLPHASHLYWMPLPSILAAISMWTFGSSFAAAQVPFVLLSSVLPLIAYVVTWRLTSRRTQAWMAALLAIFSGFYVPFWALPESFAPYAVFGSLALLLVGTGETRRVSFVAGLCVGLAHLTRADGLLLLIPMLFVDLRKIRNWPLRVIFVLLGYMLIMLPWFVRNLDVVGTPIASAGTQTLWLCDYDELFSYGVQFDGEHLLDCGIDQVLLTRLQSLGSGLLHLVAENGLIFLAPLMAVGLWRLRQTRVFRIAISYLLLLYLTMTLAFTFVGDRGGLFHSSAALLPFLYAAVPVGLEAVVDALARRRRTWNAQMANRVFGVGLVVLAAVFSITIAWGRVVGSDWNEVDAAYRQAGSWLAERSDASSVVVAGNPPGFTYHTGHPSIVIPDGDIDTLIAAARRFGARWLVLDANRPNDLASLYDNPNSEPRLRLFATLGQSYLFEIDP